MAIRVIARSPAFGVTVVLTLALGIGASTAIFSIVDGVLLRPLPYADPDRLVRLAEGYEGATPLRAGARMGSVTYHAWADAGFKSVTAIEGYSESRDVIAEIGRDRLLVRSARVTPGLFHLLGIAPARGRPFNATDAREGAESVMVVSDDLWRERFAGDDSAVGQTVAILGRPHRVVGVAPRGFGFPDDRTRMWMVLTLPPPTGPPQNPQFLPFFALARLSPGATPAQASAEATTVARRIDPKPLVARITFGDGGAAFVRATTMLDEMTSGVQTALIVVSAGIGCILLIACVNVANLMLSRGAARFRELAVRSALGARRKTLARQLLAESLVLSLAGGAIGIVLAMWAVGVLPLLAPADFPRLANVQVDLRALVVALLLSLLTAVLAGLAPIAGLTGAGLVPAFRSDGTSGPATHRIWPKLRNLLLGIETAFAVVLLVAALLLARSFATLVQVDSGYTPEGVLVASVMRPDAAQESAKRYAPLMRDALERIRALPGVEGAAIGSMSPLDDNTSLQGFLIPGWREAPQSAAGARTALARSYAVTPEYAVAMGLRLRAGRFLDDTDVSSSEPRWVVNEEFARLYLPDDPLGRYPWRRNNRDGYVEFVGIVANVLKDGNAGAPVPEIYRLLQDEEPFFNYQVVARTAEADALAPAIIQTIRNAAPDAVVTVVPLSNRFGDSVSQPRLASTVFGVLALLASSLTAIGIFAALSYTLSLRRHEFGVRVAVGATRSDLVRLAVRQGLAPTVAGIVVGLLAATGTTRFMQGVLFGVSPVDQVSFFAAPALLIPVALAAALIPALKASRLDPATTLRAE